MSDARRRGFTLIELLVVIAIISILASILFPVFARAREKGRQAACVSNVHQINLAFHMYAQDFDETLPAGSTGPEMWHDLVYAYTHNRQIYVCPSRKDSLMGYGVNDLIAGHDEGEMFDPAAKILLMDIPPEAINADGGSRGDEWWGNSISGIGIPAGGDNNSFTANTMPQRHNDGINVGYGDGHAKWGKESQLDQAHLWIPGLETP